MSTHHYGKKTRGQSGKIQDLQDSLFITNEHLDIHQRTWQSEEETEPQPTTTCFSLRTKLLDVVGSLDPNGRPHSDPIPALDSCFWFQSCPHSVRPASRKCLLRGIEPSECCRNTQAEKIILICRWSCSVEPLYSVRPHNLVRYIAIGIILWNTHTRSGFLPTLEGAGWFNVVAASTLVRCYIHPLGAGKNRQETLHDDLLGLEVKPDHFTTQCFAKMSLAANGWQCVAVVNIFSVSVACRCRGVRTMMRVWDVVYVGRVENHCVKEYPQYSWQVLLPAIQYIVTNKVAKSGIELEPTTTSEPGTKPPTLMPISVLSSRICRSCVGTSAILCRDFSVHLRFT
uniref:Uncharacterized protein n=1 Tax=Timema shepardi TaxID=629360 RepID=A0A7R9G106_TIMSH|nr:unnamed protein product [Timema shepardi]